MAAVAKLKVTYADGRNVVALAGPKAQVMTERHFKKSFSELGNAGSLEVVYFLAWSALHFSGQEPKGFDEFLDVVSEVEDAESEEANPTVKGP